MSGHAMVRVLWRPGESISDGHPWARRCSGCGESIGHWRHLSECIEDANAHAESCSAVRYFALVDRLEALRDRWRGLCIELEQLRADPEYRDGNHGFIAGARAATDDLADLIAEAHR